MRPSTNNVWINSERIKPTTKRHLQAAPAAASTLSTSAMPAPLIVRPNLRINNSRSAAAVAGGTQFRPQNRKIYSINRTINNSSSTTTIDEPSPSSSRRIHQHKYDPSKYKYISPELKKEMLEMPPPLLNDDSGK